MGREFNNRFSVRYDECGPHRWLRSSVYLSYTQEAATRDAADVGWVSNPWVIRRTRLNILHPVHYPSDLVVKTWVSGFSRSQAQRQYVFYNQRGESVVEAESLWVNLDPATLRPSRIAPGLFALWFPTGQAPSPPPMPPWDATPKQGAYRTGMTVGYALLDGQQHVNNARYLDLLDDAGWQMLAESGIAYEQTIEAGSFALRLCDIEYYAPATFNERLTIDTWLRYLTSSEFERMQEIRRGEQLIARSQSSWQWRDKAVK